MPTPTYSQIASDFGLWQEYVQTHGASEEEFNSLSQDDRVALIVKVFGPEPAINNENPWQ